MKFLTDWIYRKVYVEVGDRLECVTWGKDHTEIEVVKVSSAKNDFMYKFITVNGKDATSGDTYESGIAFLGDTYKHINI